MSSLYDEKISKCSNKFFKIKFDRNSFIGFKQEEIDKTDTEDLIMIRRAVYGYLKSKKLKKRNANFRDVFFRITRELRKRKVPGGRSKLSKILENRISLEGGIFKTVKSTVSMQSTDSTSIITCETANNSPEENFIKKNFLGDFEIPDFFNDKITKYSQKHTQNFLPHLQNKFNEKNHNFLNLVFERKLEGNFNCNFTKNMEAKLNDDGDKLFTLSNFDFNPLEADLKEMEIRSAMFNYLPEDQFFNLD